MTVGVIDSSANRRVRQRTGSRPEVSTLLGFRPDVFASPSAMARRDAPDVDGSHPLTVRAHVRHFTSTRSAARSASIGVLSRVLLLAFCLASVGPGAPLPAFGSPVLDSDQDSIPDDVERRTGTNPFERDTDRDGVADGDEDLNRDGVVDAGETDPRVPGLFPGSVPHVPEPLVFDLVRGLGARKGELEGNVLALFRPDRPHVLWAPEIEWAFADGYAVEIELPMVEDEVDAVKLALQGTFPSPRKSLAHGWQVFGESFTDWKHAAVVGTYILGHRFDRRTSVLGMLGSKVELDGPAYDRSAAIVNASVFYEPREWQTWGLESNLEAGSGRQWSLRVTPQVHLQLGRRFRAQLGVGFQRTSDGFEPIGALRLIVEAGNGVAGHSPVAIRSHGRSRSEVPG